MEKLVRQIEERIKYLAEKSQMYKDKRDQYSPGLFNYEHNHTMMCVYDARIIECNEILELIGQL